MSGVKGLGFVFRVSGLRGLNVLGFGVWVQDLPSTLCTSSTSDEKASVTDPARAPAVSATLRDLG